ncbi:hypothetical protein SpCBS45565_g06879 [Spizellomyces sp. 'palustris']|nr:hypothetical protein SpCBS45565_g06879 [Spizellomyces sp. 'palustris']
MTVQSYRPLYALVLRPISRGFCMSPCTRTENGIKKQWASAFESSKEEDKQRGRHERAHAVDKAMSGNTGDGYSDLARKGMETKNIDGPEANQPATKTDSSNISESAPKPIIGLEDERGGFSRSKECRDFRKSPERK